MVEGEEEAREVLSFNNLLNRQKSGVSSSIDRIGFRVSFPGLEFGLRELN